MQAQLQEKRTADGTHPLQTAVDKNSASCYRQVLNVSTCGGLATPSRSLIGCSLINTLRIEMALSPSESVDCSVLSQTAPISF